MVENITLVALTITVVCVLADVLGIVKPKKPKEYPFVPQKPDPSRYWANIKPEPTRMDVAYGFASLYRSLGYRISG